MRKVGAGLVLNSVQLLPRQLVMLCSSSGDKAWLAVHVAGSPQPPRHQMLTVALYCHARPQGYPDQYHFSADEVRRWVSGATSPAKRRPAAAAAEAEEPAAPASARRSARKAPAVSRTPATSARRRSLAAAKLRAVAEGEEEEAEVEQRPQGEAQHAEQEASQEEGEAAEEEEQRQQAAAPAEGRQGAASPRLRKRKMSAVGGSDEAGGRQKRQEGEDGTAVEQQEREEREEASEAGWVGEWWFCSGLPDGACGCALARPICCWRLLAQLSRYVRCSALHALVAAPCPLVLHPLFTPSPAALT